MVQPKFYPNLEGGVFKAGFRGLVKFAKFAKMEILAVA
jgi:hypothetical protein